MYHPAEKSISSTLSALSEGEKAEHQAIVPTVPTYQLPMHLDNIQTYTHSIYTDTATAKQTKHKPCIFLHVCNI